MTDRVNALVVVLEDSPRADEIQHLCDAIGQLRGVVSVSPNIGSIEDFAAKERAMWDLRKQLHDVLWPHLKEKE